MIVVHYPLLSYQSSDFFTLKILLSSYLTAFRYMHAAS